MFWTCINPKCGRSSTLLTEAAFPFRCRCGTRHEWPNGVGRANGLSFLRKSSNLVLPEVQDRSNCMYQKVELRKEVCQECCGKTTIKVLGCEIHNECTIGHKNGKGTLPGIVCCQKCKEYRAPIRFVTSVDLARDTIKLASMLPKDICAVAGIPRSGMIPASLLATHLHLPLYSLHHGGFTPIGCGWRLSDSNHLERPGPILIVDDTSMYGGAMKQARIHWDSHGPKDKHPLYVTVYCSPARLHIHGPLPNMWAVDLEDPHFLEWCLFNCGYARRMAFDLDGIMTIEGTASPQYLPRKFQLPLIVTGRFEKERFYTEQWLAAHGVKYGKMIMFPGTAQEREQPDAIARYKAENWKESRIDFFCESDPEQAKTIASIVKKPVICPAVAKVF